MDAIRKLLVQAYHALAQVDAAPTLRAQIEREMASWK